MLHNRLQVVVVSGFVHGTVALLLLILAGCTSDFDAPAVSNGPRLVAADLSEPARPQLSTGPITIAAAGNEWTSFCLELDQLPAPDSRHPLLLRVRAPQLTTANANIDPAIVSFAQILPVPCDMNHAAFVRQTGITTGASQLLDALLPLPSDRGLLNVAVLRDSAHARDPALHAGQTPGQPEFLWVDLHVPPQTRPGDYETTCDLLDGPGPVPLASVRVQLTVHDFALPDVPRLTMVGQLDWASLQRLWPQTFEAITPSWVNRTDPRYAGVVRTLDELQSLAGENGVELVAPRLQPIAKWPAGSAPKLDWEYFDSLVGPWLNGTTATPLGPLSFWPLPTIDYLDNFDAGSQQQYWSAAAAHFNDAHWLLRSAIVLGNHSSTDQPGLFLARPPAPTGEMPGALRDIELCQRAASLMASISMARVALPLGAGQLRFRSPQEAGLLDPDATNRLIDAAPALVSTAGTGQPPGSASAHQWIRADLDAPPDATRAAAEDPQTLACLAVLQKSELILFGDPLPRQSTREVVPRPSTQNPGVVVGDPTPFQTTFDVTTRADARPWFYPGEWFAADRPLASLELKRLRRAQQDYRYLQLAMVHGESAAAISIAELLARPVAVAPDLPPEAVYDLFPGTTDVAMWDEARGLLARAIEINPAPGAASRPQPLNTTAAPELQRPFDTELQSWKLKQARSFVLGRSVQWVRNAQSGIGTGDLVAQIGVDIFNAGDRIPVDSQLQFSAAPYGWQYSPGGIAVGPLDGFHVQRYVLETKVNPDAVVGHPPGPLQVTFTDGRSHLQTTSPLMIPVVNSDRREGGIVIDGQLGDWNAADAIQNGPMVRMFDRPTLQKQDVRVATVPADVFSAWADENFYVAFKLTGLSTLDAHFTRNFAVYEEGRAWGEDLCEVLVQADYGDGTLGPLLLIVCKPSGIWTERRLDPRTHADPWVPLEGAAVRYAATVASGDWRGEMAIPWAAVAAESRGRPPMLRFNFIQHLARTGESASWAGPIDFGRDDSFMGLIHLRDLTPPLMER